jgi:hypothetical protein|nr:MAG TPA: Helicase ATPase REPLICATION [Crassvirales sp.]
MAVYERTLEDIKAKRQNLLNGGINSIPSTFSRFRSDFIGVEQSTYYCVTSATKGGKSQFASYTFIFVPLLYAYYNRQKVRVKVFYYALEETPERVMQRFMSHILFHLSGGKIRVSPRDLRSSDNSKPLAQEIIDLLESPEYAALFKFFEDSIEFSTTSNPTGIYKECKRYAEENGTVYTRKSSYRGELGEMVDTNSFDHYVPNDPGEYKIIFIDHMGLIDTERGMNLKQSMDKLSEYLAKYLRNNYGFSPVVIQQQSFENESNDNFTSGRLRPTAQGLGDSKYIARDCNILLGLFSPFKFELQDYKKYNINIFRDNIRFLEVLLNRDGEMGGLCPLFFDGAVCDFKELPLPQETEKIKEVYKYLDYIRGEEHGKPVFMMTSGGVHKRWSRNLQRWKRLVTFAQFKNKEEVNG